MKIGIIGSRRRYSKEDYQETLKAFVSIYKPGDTLVSGNCPLGGDQFANTIARLYKVPIKLHKPDWKHYGKGAGFQRNGLIAQDADVLIACVAGDRTGGTEDTIRKFQKLGKTNIILT